MEYYIHDKFPFSIENFVDDKTCDEIVKFIEQKGNSYFQPSPIEYWSNRTISAHSIKNEEIYTTVKDIFNKVNPVVNSVSAIPDQLYADTLDLVRWKPGTELTPHIDNAEPDGSPNISPWRKFSSLIYLNDDFDGGEIFWTRISKELKPKKGMLVIFPSDAAFQHGVKMVQSGTRYTLCSFYSYDKRYNISMYL